MLGTVVHVFTFVRTHTRTHAHARILCSQDLGRLLGSEASKRVVSTAAESAQAMGAAACLIKYLDLLADENLFGKFKLRELALDGHMKLDRAATKALNLFPQVHARTHARTSARAHTHIHQGTEHLPAGARRQPQRLAVLAAQQVQNRDWLAAAAALAQTAPCRQGRNRGPARSRWSLD